MKILKIRTFNLLRMYCLVFCLSLRVDNNFWLQTRLQFSISNRRVIDVKV